MPLTKIPFILLATWGFYVSTTPPNPPASRDSEHIASRMALENAAAVYWGALITRYFQLVICAAEVATILASASPSSPLSNLTLSLLVWNGGRPDNLRMSNATAIGLISMMLGTWIRLMTYRYLGQFFSFEAIIQKDHQLIVSGPYAIVRHPSYTGLLFLFIGWFPWQLSEGSWIIESGLWDMILGRTLVVVYISLCLMGVFHLILKRMPEEDAALRKKFGIKWDDWAKDVPHAILPGIY